MSDKLEAYRDMTDPADVSAISSKQTAIAAESAHVEAIETCIVHSTSKRRCPICPIHLLPSLMGYENCFRLRATVLKAANRRPTEVFSY
jgi:hypothetical protein